MMDKDDSLGAELEDFLAAARAAPPQVPEALMARVMADAEAARPRPADAGLIRGWFAALGGLPGLGGLITATCVGFWLGLAPPDGLPDLAAGLLGSTAELEQLLGAPGETGFGWDIGEG